MDAARLLAMPLLAGLHPEDVAAIADVASERAAAAGEVVVAEGDFGHALFLVEEGTAEVRSGDRVLRTLGPGDVFGEIAVVAAGRRTASVAATSPMRLIAIFKRDVWALERSSPEAAGRLRDLVAERRDPAPSA